MYKDGDVRHEAFELGEFEILRELRASQFAQQVGRSTDFQRNLLKLGIA